MDGLLWECCGVGGENGKTRESRLVIECWIMLWCPTYLRR